MNLIGRLQKVCDDYCSHTGLRREQVSYQVFRDQRRLSGVFAGERGLTVESYENAMRWLSENWPEGLDWPADVERPGSDVGATSGAAA